jgi:hypothetical protein
METFQSWFLEMLTSDIIHIRTSLLLYYWVWALTFKLSVLYLYFSVVIILFKFKHYIINHKLFIMVLSVFMWVSFVNEYAKFEAFHVILIYITILICHDCGQCGLNQMLVCDFGVCCTWSFSRPKLRPLARLRNTISISTDAKVSFTWPQDSGWSRGGNVLRVPGHGTNSTLEAPYLIQNLSCLFDENHKHNTWMHL